jgi:spore germination cell wall hydrolase CwlJ-like protein
MLRKNRWRRFASVGCAAFAFALIPNSIGFQDLGALLVRQPGVAARAQRHVIASPFGTIHAAMFSLPRPLGTGIPHPPLYALANFDPADIAASIASQFLGDPRAPLQFPTVDRRHKRDSFLARPRAPLPPLPPLLKIEPAALPLPAASFGAETGERFDPYSEYEFAAALDEASAASGPQPSAGEKSHARKDGSRVYFAAGPLAAGAEAITPWAPGEAPVRMALHASGDADLKQSALVPPLAGGDEEAGESIARKGEVSGPAQRPQTPAERLALTGKARAKAEKCLANAVYFEARGEPVRGQIAVAQVVMNRVFSPFYPNDVCDVVYQNANRHLACQFTFACDGIPDVVTEPEAWARARHIARDMLDGTLWMPEVAKSTHYHAYWVHPSWTAEMKKMYKLGVHTFYRPRAWGDGADEPHWGDPKTTAEEVKKL